MYYICHYTNIVIKCNSMFMEEEVHRNQSASQLPKSKCSPNNMHLIAPSDRVLTTSQFYLAHCPSIFPQFLRLSAKLYVCLSRMKSYPLLYTSLDFIHS